MYVCMCLGVTESEIRACIRMGAATLDEISERCAAGTGCGGCLDSVEAILDGTSLTAATLGEINALPRSA